jgi:uncharacterized membrane protein YesL
VFKIIPHPLGKETNESNLVFLHRITPHPLGKETTYMNILSNDGWFARIFGNIGDIIVLNILFVICCIPVFTIGASMSALYYALMKKIRTGSIGGVTRMFFTGFKDNFKKSTLAWLLFLVVAFIFKLDFNLFGNGGPMENNIIYYACVVLLMLVIFIAIYLFPVISAFENTLKNLIIQAAFLAAKNFIFTLIILILYTIPVYILLSSPQIFMVGIFVMAVAGFGVIAYCAALLFTKAFTPYLDEVTKKYSDDDPSTWMHIEDSVAEPDSDSKKDV